jgi:hypothetical protein
MAAARMTHGFLNVLKPAGISSHHCVVKVRKLLKTRQVGHAGTLDPMATGVLTMALGNATKFLQVRVRCLRACSCAALLNDGPIAAAVPGHRQGVRWRCSLWRHDRLGRRHRVSGARTSSRYTQAANTSLSRVILTEKFCQSDRRRG